MNITPKVSIITISYNQESYIREALDSFVMQKTNFNFEVIIGDDGSSDKTQSIIQEYADKYPTIIRPVLRTKNIGAWQNFIDVIKRARGNYIALCEGDDYWTDKFKLQKQVDFLEKHSDYALCFHPVIVYREDTKEKTTFPDTKNKDEFTVENLLRNNFIQTNSVMYRKQSYSKLAVDVMPGDWYLHLYHAQYGKIGFIDKEMSVYRRHQNGIWWQTTENGNIDEIWKKYGISHLTVYVELLKIYGKNSKYSGIIDNHISGTISALSRIDGTQNTRLMEGFTNKIEEPSKLLILSLSRLVYANYKFSEELSEKLRVLENNLQEVISKNKRLEQEKFKLEIDRESIINSRIYKTGLMVTAPYRNANKLLKRGDKHE